MKLFQFKATIRHDNGSFNLSTVATSRTQAKLTICKAENCPESAILSIKKVKRIV